MSALRRMRGSLLAAASLALTAALLAAPPASGAAPSYVALGDSYSSGTGAPPYQNAGCLRSSRSYAPLWASSHAVSSFAFPACGGATTSDVLGSQLGSLNANTDLVTITIGGNDIGFADVMTTCTLGGNTSCVNAVNGATNEANTLLPARLDATYAAIRAAAPNALVIVLGYPRLISPTGSCGLFNLSTTKRTALNNGADILDAVIAGRVAAAGPMRPVVGPRATCATGRGRGLKRSLVAAMSGAHADSRRDSVGDRGGRSGAPARPAIRRLRARRRRWHHAGATHGRADRTRVHRVEPGVAEVDARCGHLDRARSIVRVAGSPARRPMRPSCLPISSRVFSRRWSRGPTWPAPPAAASHIRSSGCGRCACATISAMR